MDPTDRVILTIGRQIGSGGLEMGQRISRRLSCPCIDRQIVAEAAKYLGANEEDIRCHDERVSRFWERAARVFISGTPDTVFTDLQAVAPLFDAQIFAAQTKVIHELIAGRSAVVIGHAGFHILRKEPGLIRVFVHACTGYRVRHLMSLHGLPDERQAKALIERTDRERERFVKEIAGGGWTDARNYDLCIDTGRVSEEAADRMVMDLIEHRRGREPQIKQP